jgi:peptidyl-prolyl cis-trans isomerase C
MFSKRLGVITRTSVFAVPLTMALQACGSSAPPSGQVVAEVGDKEVTSAQLWLVLQKVNPQSARDPFVRKLTMDSLIDETLFMTAAERDNLEQQPSVARELDRARRTVLAEAYLARLVPSAPITDAEATQFYSANPAMFSARREYRVVDLTVRGGKELDQFVAPLGTQISLEQLTDRLRSGQRTGEVREMTFTSDAVDPGLATQLATLGPGAHYSFRDGSVRHFVRIISVNPAPLPVEAARPQIKAYLQQARGMKAARDRLSALRAEHGVTLGEAGRKIEVESKRAAPSQIIEPLDKAPAPDSTRRTGETITRGLEGL